MILILVHQVPCVLEKAGLGLATYRYFATTQSVLKSQTVQTKQLSGFTHKNLPFLFGVCIGGSPSIVTSFHGFDNQSITLHDALYTQSVQIKNLVMDIKWVTILEEIICGLEQLHTKHEILHNDLKGASGC